MDDTNSREQRVKPLPDRTRRVSVMITDEEYWEWISSANRQKLRLSEWLRFLASAQLEMDRERILTE